MGDATPVTRCQVLLVDDDPAIRTLVRTMLSDEGYVVCAASTTECALALVRRDTPALMLLDVIGRDQPVDCVVAQARAVQPDLAIVLFTALGAVEAEAIQARLPDVGLLRKPFDLDDLLSTVRRSVTDGRVA